MFAQGLAWQEGSFGLPVSFLGLTSYKGCSGCMLEGCMDLDVTDMSWFWDGHAGKTNSLLPPRFSFAL